MIKAEFLFTISLQYKADKWWEQKKNYQLGDY